ncbi:MAG: HEAT repeat domain-containing protein, partial [Anaerolineae bacterium]|nr:HEAT repeat domain-containing protein [Anaerolineae bacterium]
MTNSEQRFFSGQTLITRSTASWLLQDLQPSLASIVIDQQPPLSHVAIDHLRYVLCTSDNPHQQRKAALELATIGPEAVPALVYAFHQSCETCQVLAAYALRKLGAAALKPLLMTLDTCPS